jgi:hypothetical protein
MSKATFCIFTEPGLINLLKTTSGDIIVTVGVTPESQQILPDATVEEFDNHIEDTSPSISVCGMLEGKRLILTFEEVLYGIVHRI